jgi:hypothetical protein
LALQRSFGARDRAALARTLDSTFKISEHDLIRSM